MEENHDFLQPLLISSSTTNTSSSPATATADPPPPPPPLNDHRLVSSNSGIITRLALVFSIGMVSIWANHEASKGFAITIVNESVDTLPGKRFQLLYVSNDEATRMVIQESRVVENFLYSDSESRHIIRKRVDHVIIKLARQNLTDNVIVDMVKDREFVLNISPSVLDTNFGHVMSQLVQRGMARIWIWDGQGNAPRYLVNGIIEYITSKLGRSDIKYDPKRYEASRRVGSCNWKPGDPKAVADFLDHCERHRPGFIRRLNQGMRDEWHDRKLEIALGLPIQNLCATNGSR